MFDGRNPYLGIRGKGPREMVENRVVGFRGAGRTGAVQRVADKKLGEALPGGADRCVSAAADAMRARGVTHELARRFQPCLPRFRQHGGRGVVVEVDHFKSVSVAEIDHETSFFSSLVWCALLKGH